jgi:hypothetical protein
MIAKGTAISDISIYFKIHIIGHMDDRGSQAGREWTQSKGDCALWVLERSGDHVKQHSDVEADKSVWAQLGARQSRKR